MKPRPRPLTIRRAAFSPHCSATFALRAGFFAVAFLGAAFLAGDAFFAGAFLGATFFATFLGGAFLAGAFLATFLGAAFLTTFLVAFWGALPAIALATAGTFFFGVGFFVVIRWL